MPLEINTLHQVDLVGPRYIKGDGRFYSLNVIDVCSHRIKLNPILSKIDEEIANGLISTWKILGIPEYIQFDNELSFHGSHKHPHSLGLVLRLCLSLGIQPIFIPQREPWRNGVIESFNDVYDKGFFRIQVFKNFFHLKKESKAFEEFHNEFHRYSVLKGKTPNEFMRNEGVEPFLLVDGFELPHEPIPIEDGNIHLVRFIRSDRILDVFGEHFQMPKDVVYEYVVATIMTATHSLRVVCNDKIVDFLSIVCLQNSL
ncbi:MAG: integrase core domain-containing protein [bacterium]